MYDKFKKPELQDLQLVHLCIGQDVPSCQMPVQSPMVEYCSVLHINSTKQRWLLSVSNLSFLIQNYKVSDDSGTDKVTKY
jgi:hypothetical protein